MGRKEKYVPVIVRFEAEGRLRPLLIEFDESHKYPVDRGRSAVGLRECRWGRRSLCFHVLIFLPLFSVQPMQEAARTFFVVQSKAAGRNSA